MNTPPRTAGQDGGPETPNAYVIVTDAVYRRAKAAGAEIVLDI